MKHEIQIPKGMDIMRYETLYDTEFGNSLLVIEFGKRNEIQLANNMYVKIKNKDTDYFGIVKRAGYHITEFYILLKGEKREKDIELLNSQFTWNPCSRTQIDIIDNIMKKHGYYFENGLKRYNGRTQKMILELEKQGYKIKK